jgi:hypothetical protein
MPGRWLAERKGGKGATACGDGKGDGSVFDVLGLEQRCAEVLDRRTYHGVGNRCLVGLVDVHGLD